MIFWMFFCLVCWVMVCRDFLSGEMWLRVVSWCVNSVRFLVFIFG